MNIDLEQLKNAAQAATPGEWETNLVDDLTANGTSILLGTIDGEGRFDRKEDARFVAAANPAVVLALVARLEAAEQRAGEMEERYDRLTNDFAAKQARLEQAEDALRTAEEALANCYDVTCYPGKVACSQGDALDAVRDALKGSHVVMAVCPKCFECFDPTTGAAAQYRCTRCGATIAAGDKLTCERGPCPMELVDADLSNTKD